MPGVAPHSTPAVMRWACCSGAESSQEMAEWSKWVDTRWVTSDVTAIYKYLNQVSQASAGAHGEHLPHTFRESAGDSYPDLVDL